MTCMDPFTCWLDGSDEPCAPNVWAMSEACAASDYAKLLWDNWDGGPWMTGTMLVHVRDMAGVASVYSVAARVQVVFVATEVRT